MKTQMQRLHEEVSEFPTAYERSIARKTGVSVTQLRKEMAEATGLRCERCNRRIAQGDPVHDVAVSVEALPLGATVDESVEHLSFDPGVESYLCDPCGEQLSMFLDGRKMQGERPWPKS